MDKKIENWSELFSLPQTLEVIDSAFVSQNYILTWNYCIFFIFYFIKIWMLKGISLNMIQLLQFYDKVTKYIKYYYR